MKVTEAVIRDLHVLVQADEASPDSQALVAAWSKHDAAGMSLAVCAGAKAAEHFVGVHGAVPVRPVDLKHPATLRRAHLHGCVSSVRAHGTVPLTRTAIALLG